MCDDSPHLLRGLLTAGRRAGFSSSAPTFSLSGRSEKECLSQTRVGRCGAIENGCSTRAEDGSFALLRSKARRCTRDVWDKVRSKAVIMQRERSRKRQRTVRKDAQKNQGKCRGR